MAIAFTGDCGGVFYCDFQKMDKSGGETCGREPQPFLCRREDVARPMAAKIPRACVLCAHAILSREATEGKDLPNEACAEYASARKLRKAIAGENLRIERRRAAPRPARIFTAAHIGSASRRCGGMSFSRAVARLKSRVNRPAAGRRGGGAGDSCRGRSPRRARRACRPGRRPAPPATTAERGSPETCAAG